MEGTRQREIGDCEGMHCFGVCKRLTMTRATQAGSNARETERERMPWVCMFFMFFMSLEFSTQGWPFQVHCQVHLISALLYTSPKRLKKGYHWPEKSAKKIITIELLEYLKHLRDRTGAYSRSQLAWALHRAAIKKQQAVRWLAIFILNITQKS